MSEAIETRATNNNGWKPIPLPLKILFVVFILWLVGAVINLPNLVENGLPLFGNFVFGKFAAVIVLFLDILGPMLFLFGLWTRRSWAPKWAFAYIGFFILNNTVALFTVSAKIGIPQIIAPTVAALIFLAVIYWKRSYFNQTP
ncbi:MAG: hypothetical protein JKY32_04565 [Rhizobiales bacterium]|nr:hypothetical protein [Hyphomicrobiales bacterium]